MTEEAEREIAQRRVYILPTELVDRITAFQKERSFTSEVEAVRHLLDEALLGYDTHESLLYKLYTRLNKVKVPRDAVRDIMFGHPLVSSVNFEDRNIIIRFKNSVKVLIDNKGDMYIESTDGDIREYMPF